jgi:hypothetical protein
MKCVVFLATVAVFAVVFPASSHGFILGALHLGRTALNSVGSGREEPPFTLIEETNDYEVRLYPQRKWACTNSTDEDEARTRYLFYRLFDYITGANTRGAKIEMTVPVATLNPYDEDRNMRMCFFVPEAYQYSTPTPTDPRVYIVNDQEVQVAVRRFSGYPSLAEWNEQLHKLREALEAAGKAGAYDFSTYIRAGYDAPWKFYNRRNEVLIRQKS